MRTCNRIDTIELHKTKATNNLKHFVWASITLRCVDQQMPAHKDPACHTIGKRELCHTESNSAIAAQCIAIADCRGHRLQDRFVICVFCISIQDDLSCSAANL